MQQQVLAVPGGVDPLAERLLETVVAVGNVLGRGPARAGAIRPENGPSTSWLRSFFAAIARACSCAMRSRVASRTTRTSPCLRRKPEINSAGNSAAIAGAVSSRKPVITLPIARSVIIPGSPIAHETSTVAAHFSIGNVDASRHRPCVCSWHFSDIAEHTVHVRSRGKASEPCENDAIDPQRNSPASG